MIRIRKFLLGVGVVALALSTTSHAGVVRFTAKHVVVPVAKGSVKVAKVAGHASVVSVTKAGAKGAKTVGKAIW